MEHDGSLDKRYYKIRDVSDMLDIPQPTLRFWEKEFPRLKPRRNEGGTRFYTPDDIELLRQIKFLVKHKGLKIAAARDELSRRSDKIKRQADIMTRLTDIRAKLIGLRDALTERRRLIK